MKKQVKAVGILILLMLFVAIAFMPYSEETISSLKSFVYHGVPESDAHLVVDTTNNKTLPNHFRKFSGEIIVPKGTEPLNLKGMSTLNISGSKQFTPGSLALVKKAIGDVMPITDVDLRQESHGFINDIAVSWANEKNNANAGLTMAQVIQKETIQLESIPLNEPIHFYNRPNLTVIPQRVENEKKLVTSQGIAYLRVPVTDGKIPTDDMVDYFVKFAATQQPRTWLHFHCKQGIGRTTTFMIMYDMMKNAKQVDAQDIIKRQVALSTISPASMQSFYNQERIGFLTNFHKYCKENTDNFKTPWTKWLAQSH